MQFILTTRKKITLLIILLLLHLIIISIQVPLGKETGFFLKKNIFAFFSTIQNSIHSIYTYLRDFSKNYIFLSNTYKEKEKLKKENLYLKTENWILKEKLKKIQTERQLSESKFLIAQVIGLDPLNIYKCITINKGFNHGIQKNLPVLDKHRNLIGKTVEPISDNQSTVQLITDSESGVGVISKKTKAIGVLTGTLSEKCVFKYVYITQEVNKGEEVITSGLDTIFPRGIKIGKITKIKKGKGLFKEIEVSPYFRINELDNILILLK